MKHILFRRILLAYLVFAPLFLVTLEIYLSSVVRDTYLSHLRERLLIQAHLIAERTPISEADNLDQFCKDYRNKTGTRITVIDASGRVLGDSDEPSAGMENHGNRPEIREAYVSDVGTAIRFSTTLGEKLFYLAIAFGPESERKFLRLSLPLSDIDAAVNGIRMKIVAATLAVSCVAILLALIQARRITKSIEEIAAFSKEAAAGNFSRRLFLKDKSELGELGTNIGDMAHQLHERLKQSEEEKRKIEAILRNMSEGLILTDVKGTILLSNAAVTRLVNAPSSMEGKTLIEVMRKPELMDMVEHVVATKERVSQEIDVDYPRALHLLVTAAPFYADRNEGELSGIVFTFHDITRLKKLEEIRKDFVANVSHEIKTPITAIQGFTETLLEGAIEDREHAYRFLRTIKQNSERLNSLVTDLLTLSRIELGDVVLHKDRVNLDDVVDTVFTILGEKAQSKGLSLSKRIPPGNETIEADRDRLIQILLNLVDNGIKYTEKGGVTITVKREEVTEKHGEEAHALSPTSVPQPSTALVITVEDTGIGIPKKHLSRLGERFYRVDRARSRELGGTGLGLAIVKHLVKAHGWDMEIESTEGQGTTVRIVCPSS